MKQYFLLAIGLFLGFSVLQAQKPTVLPGYQPDAFYLKFKAGTLNLPKGDSRHVPVSALFPTATKGKLQKYGLRAEAFCLRLNNNPALQYAFKLRFDSVQNADLLLRQLQQDPRVELVERVPLYRAAACPSDGFPRKNNPKDTPNDSFYGIVDNIHASWYLDKMGFAELYGKYTGNPDIKVAVVDNAVWNGHEDLTILPENLYNTCTNAQGEADPPSNIDRDIVYKPHHWIGMNPAYNWSHGTHCAGLIAAVNNNGKGIVSLASGVSLMGIRTAESDPNIFDNIMEGVAWAIDHGAKVISMSYGAGYNSSIEREFFLTCANRGIVLMAAAGNEGRDKEQYPACYPGVIAVGSVNSDGHRSDFSNYGDWVDVWVPGGYYIDHDTVVKDQQLLSTTWCVSQWLDDKPSFSGQYYDMMIGTSMATPLAASASALILSYYPELNGYQIKEILQRAMQDSCVYVPEAFRLLENDRLRQVRDLQAGRDEAAGQVEVIWKAPEQEGVTAYRLYHGETYIGQTEAGTTRFGFSAPDTTGFVGVRAIYGQDSSLLCCVPIRKGAPEVSNQEQPESASSLRFWVNQAERSLHLSEDNWHRLEIFDVKGRLVMEKEYGAGSVSLQGLPSGLYLCRVWNGPDSSTFKFVLP